jgi:hypothetical protein
MEGIYPPYAFLEAAGVVVGGPDFGIGPEADLAGVGEAEAKLGQPAEFGRREQLGGQPDQMEGPPEPVARTA